MPSITKEQYVKWNSKAQNGWNLDVQEYVVWGEKCLVKRVPINDKEHIEYKLTWQEDSKPIINQYGENTYTIGSNTYMPVLHVNKWKESNSTKGIYIMVGTGDSKVLGKAQDRKNFNLLCKLSKELDKECVGE